VKLTVVNKVGKQAVVEILGPGDFSWCTEFFKPVRLHGDRNRDSAGCPTFARKGGDVDLALSLGVSFPR
jgi:hypothetical protein